VSIVANYRGNGLLAIVVTLYYARRMDLIQRTYELIDGAKSSLTSREIADGAGVDINWFNKFRQRRIDSPGAPKVQAVYDFLCSKTGRRRAGSDARKAAHG
jgi:hypothetical protein